MIVTGCKAMVTADARAAHDLFAEALAVPESDRWSFEHARLQLIYGEHLRRSGATRESRAQLTDALERFEWLGAGPWAARAKVWAKGEAPKDLAPVDAAHELGNKPRDVFVYFIHEGKLHAPAAAMALIEKLG